MRSISPQTRLRLAWAGIFITSLMACVLLTLLFLTTRSYLTLQQPSDHTPAEHIADTVVNPYGANLFLEREVEAWKREKTLKMAADAGLGWVKLHFPWEAIEPARKGDYFDPITHAPSWSKFDQIVAECEKYGLRIVARLDRPPAWSRSDNSLAEAPPDNYQDYGDFVYAFVRHYRGRIGYIQIWNEPNIYPEWGNHPVDPAAYTELLQIAYRRAKEADPNITVLSAPLAYTLGQPHPEPGKWIAMSDLEYLKGMYEAGAAGHFDILSANAFGFDQPPESPPDPAVLNFQRVVLQHDIMAEHGDTEKAVWFNEFGWNAAPEDFPPDKLIWQRVSEADQAAYTVRAIQMARRDWPWAGVFMVWYMRQVGNIPADRADYYFRMVDTDFTPRPLYSAIQRAAADKPVMQAGTYQENYALVQTTGSWEPVLDTQTSGTTYVYTNVPGSAISFTFRGNHLELLTRKGPLDGELLILVDDKPVPGLPQRNGQSVISLAAEDARYEWLTLWRGAEPGPHKVSLALAEPSIQGTPTNLVFDALRVSDETSAFPWLNIILLGLGCAASVAGAALCVRYLRRSRRQTPS